MMVKNVPPNGRWARLLWRVRLWKAEHLGSYRYRGLLCTPLSWPYGRVYYPDVDKFSINMPLGNCVEYAEMFKGVVYPPREPLEERVNNKMRELADELRRMP